MRTLLLVAATLGVFGTGCGGCVDDDKKPHPNVGTIPNYPAAPRKYQVVQLAPDASITDTPPPPPDSGK